MSSLVQRLLVYSFVLACVPLADAQPVKLYQAGVLVVGSADVPELKGLRQGLTEAGYIEGKNLLVDIGARNSYDAIRSIAKSYMDRKFDVIVGVGGTVPLIVREMTQNIPIVSISAVDPVGSGLVKSVSQPGGNVTGVARGTDVELQGKRLQVFTEAVPKLQRVAVLYNARGENPGHAKNLALLQKVAASLKLKINPDPIKSAEDIDRTLSSLSKATTDGVVVICSGIFRPSFKKIVTSAIEKKLPLLACDADHENEEGGLLFYDTNRLRLGHRAAWYVDRILKGTKPQDLPFESPTYFELIINLKTAKQIGVTISPNVLARADRVIR